jgi:DNA-binding HxlR family transcriptional regulator
MWGHNIFSYLFPAKTPWSKVAATLNVKGGKRKGVIVFHLLSGTKRFNELIC